MAPVTAACTTFAFNTFIDVLVLFKDEVDEELVTDDDDIATAAEPEVVLIAGEAADKLKLDTATVV